MTDEQIKVRIEQIDKELEVIDAELEKIEEKWDFSRPYDEYQLERLPFARRYGALYAEKRQIMPYKLSELSSFGNVMKLEDFIECVKCGGFCTWGYELNKPLSYHIDKDGKWIPNPPPANPDLDA